MLRNGSILLVDTGLSFRVMLTGKKPVPVSTKTSNAAVSSEAVFPLFSVRIIFIRQNYFLLLMLESVSMFFMEEPYMCSLQKINSLDHFLQFPTSLIYD